MSYDLFLKPRSGELSVADFEAYFTGRSCYNVEANQAWYQNEETGVYFVFEYQGEDEEEIGEQEEEEFEHYPVSFNMNFFRPSFFVREAEPEVAAFVSQLGLVVEDPQVNGMGSGEYDSQKFVSGWLSGNEFGYQSILKEAAEVHCLPSVQLEKAWEWNYGREDLQVEVTEDVFVPIIMLLKYKQDVVTACVWPDAIPSVLPPVDVLLIARKEFAPRRFFRKSEDMTMGSWTELRPLLEDHKSKMLGEAYYLSYRTVPEPIKDYVKQLAPIDLGSLERLPPDQVLDRELVEKYAG